MKTNVIVSKQDLEHLELLRKNVTAFIEKSSQIYDANNLKLLDIAPQVHAGAKASFKKAHISTLDIDPNSSADYIADLCTDNSGVIPSQSFDVIVCTEVLEHTLQPFNAVNEIHRLLVKDGIVLITVPFNFRIHGPLPDCWRFTEHGIRALLTNKFEILELTELKTQDRDLMPVHYTVTARKI